METNTIILPMNISTNITSIIIIIHSSYLTITEEGEERRVEEKKF